MLMLGLFLGLLGMGLGLLEQGARLGAWSLLPPLPLPLPPLQLQRHDRAEGQAKNRLKITVHLKYRDTL